MLYLHNPSKLKHLKLKETQPSIGMWNFSIRKSRREEIILLECERYCRLRQKYFNETNMKDFFEKTSPDNIIDFLKEAELYKML